MTLLDVMIVVGGITDFADGNGAKLSARLGGQQALQHTPQGSIEARGHLSQRGRQAGDVLIIPQSWF